jgi:GTP-binding protein
MKIVSAEFVKSSTGLENCPDQGHLEVALAGRSNVGKSSLLNKLTNRKKLARISNTPGRTQTINYYIINGNIYLVDLPGYGYAKVPEKIRAKWGPMIEGYLSGREQLQGVIVLVDIRHQPTAQDMQMCRWLRFYGLPFAVVATKADKISRGRIQKHLAVVKKTLELGKEDILIPFSAQTGAGREEVLEIIEKWL